MAAFHASASVATERRFFAWLCSAILAIAVVGFTRTYLPQGKPVLWDIRWEGGHTTGIDYDRIDADVFAFLLRQLGHPDFQPARAK
jgi:hypothetical protein